LTNQPQPTDWVGWRQLLQLGEQLMAAPTLAAQIELILETAAHLFSGQVDLWLADVFHRLPCLEDLPISPTAPPSELMGSALESRQSSLADEAGGETHQPALAVPLLVNDVVLGALQVERSGGPAFGESEIQLLKGLALQSAIALQATLQLEVERWRIEQLSLVRTVSAQVANVLDLDELFRRVADLILDTFKYYYVALFTAEPGQETLRFRASAGPPGSDADKKKRSRAVLHVRIGDGIIGHVAQTGQEVLANDVERDLRYRYEDALPETRAEVALPLKIEERILGVLDVQSDQPDDFDETDMLVLRALAHNISVAVEDARLYSDLRRRADQLSAVAEAGRAVASILDLDELLEEVVTLIRRRFGYPFVHIYTVNPGRQQIIYQAGSGARSKALRGQGLVYSLEDPKGIIPWVARQGQAVLANDVTGDPRYRPSELLPTSTSAELAVPLIFGGGVLGVLDVQSDRRDAFSDEDKFLLEALADNVAIAIRNANLYRSEQWRRQVADSLREVAGLLSADLALDQVLDAILIELERTLPCDVAAIWLLQDEAEVQMRLAAVRGCTVEEKTQLSQLSPEANSWLAQALQADRPIIRDSQAPIEPMGVVLKFPPGYSAIASPLRVGDQHLGLLALAYRAPGYYGSESQAMTAAFASYAAVAIENTQLYEAAQEQAWISTVLLQVAEATQSLTTLDQILETVVRLLPMLVGVGRCALLLSSRDGANWSEPTETFVPAIAYGFSPSQKAFFDKWHVVPGEVPAFDHLRVLRSPMVIQDGAHDPRIPEAVASALGLGALVILPLLARGKVLGVMLVDYEDAPPAFDDERLALLRGIAHQTAAAIENAQLLEARQEEAYVSAALLQVAQAVASFNDLDDILSAVVRITPMLVGVEWCIIILWDDESALFRPVEAYGIPRSASMALLSQRYAPGEFPLLDAVSEGDNWLVLDEFGDWGDLIPSGFADDFVDWLRSATGQRTAVGAGSETHSVVALPLSVKGSVLGVMLVEESPSSGQVRDRRLEIISGIAQQAALAVQSDFLQQEIAEREQLERELQLAREIQQTFMPDEVPHLPGWELAVTWRAARQVAGDFYDFFELPGKKLGLVIADVADKGLPAALFMALTRALVRASALEDESPAAVLARVNALLLPDSQQGMFVTAVYAILSLETGQLIYSVAGHNLPLLWRSRTRELEQLDRGGMALGVLEEVNLEDRMVSLEPGDHLVFYTDGITEAFSEEGDIYGEERLWMVVQSYGDQSARAMLEAIDNSIAAFVGDGPPSDDITFLVLRRLATCAFFK
jgi:sigma-B regulation protein RsbU (phosphoserine phosphatase)